MLVPMFSRLLYIVYKLNLSTLFTEEHMKIVCEVMSLKASFVENVKVKDILEKENNKNPFKHF